MTAFDYFQPNTLEEASALLSSQSGRGKIIAGGTEILIRIKERELFLDHLVSLSNIDGLRSIQEEGKEVSIGSMTTLTDLENSSSIQKAFPVLFDGIGKIGSVQIRNVATLGGNLCNAAPCADSAPPLLVLNAQVSYWHSGTVRRKKLEEFFEGPGKTFLAPEDILLGVHIKVPDPRSSGTYLKLSRRRGMDIALLGIAVQVRLDASMDFFEDAAIALGVAAPTPIRMTRAEEVLKGERVTDEILRKAADLASREAKPRDSFRCSSEYRRDMIKALLPEVVKTTISRIRNGGGKG